MPRIGDWERTVVRQNTPTHWDLLNQYWTVKLVPATTARLAEILQTPPPTVSATGYGSETGGRAVTLPNLGEITEADLNLLNTH